MKIIGYCWASEQAENDDLPEPSEGVRLIWQYLKRRRWNGPVHLESPDEAFVEFHLRTAGKDVLTLLRPSDVLVVPDQSYLFRSASQGLAFLKMMHNRQVAVHCVDRGANISQGKLFETFVSILAPLAQAEPRLLRERIRLRKRQGKVMGRYLGGNVPIGFSVTADGHLEANGNREAILKRVLELKMKGLSLRAIASKLQDRGYRISHTGVDRILKSVGYSARAASAGDSGGAAMMD
jgi:putative DNA-invertase from lambdoid prophage Rac